MTDLVFRPGRPEDSSDLVILLDSASRRLAAWYWSTIATQGQSWFEVGRARTLNNADADSHHRNWHVAERAGETLGALFGFSLPDPYDRMDLAQLPAPLRAMYELEVVAKGCWLLQAVALFAEHRGKGLGPVLMDRACQAARDAGHRRIALEVESPNTGAIGLYVKCGFAEWERRPFVPFPGSDDTGDWILMVKDL